MATFCMVTLDAEDTQECAGSDDESSKPGAVQTKHDAPVYRKKTKSDVTGKALEKLGEGLQGSFDSVAQGLIIMAMAAARNPAVAPSTTKDGDLDGIERRYKLPQKWWGEIDKYQEKLEACRPGETVKAQRYTNRITNLEQQLQSLNK